jgi:membrane protease YdiL (CAAX protease family)
MTLLLATSPNEALVQAAILLALLGISAAIWIYLFSRWKRGKPIIRLARRRPVPWLGQDVLFIILIGLMFPILATYAVRGLMKSESARHVAGEERELSHPAEQLLRTGNPLAVAVAVAMAVVVAPLFEEFLFRVLLQGWMEAVWSRRRRKHPWLRMMPLSWLPVLIPAVLFALMHRRSSATPLSPQYLTALFLVQLAADLVTFGAAIMLLRFAAGATAADLGWNPGKIMGDVKLGLGALMAAIGPVLALQVVLMAVVKATGSDYAPDPIPLFFLALLLGVLYRRTHRLAPSLVLHVALNTTAIVLFFLGAH